MKRYTLIWSWMCLTTILLVGCTTDDNTWSEDYDIEWPITTIESVQPLAAAPGATLTITGKNLQHTHYFYIGNFACEIVSKSDGQLTVLVPDQVTERSQISVLNVYRRTFVFKEAMFTPAL